jgi:hemerythrin
MIEWSADLSVGVGRIDAEHQELVKTFGELQRAMREGKGNEKVVETLRFLGRYARSHFATEESLMLAYRYPKMVEHRAAHEEFKADFATILKDVTEGSRMRVATTVNVSGRLLDWLFRHIKGMDQELGQYLAARGAS